MREREILNEREGETELERARKKRLEGRDKPFFYCLSLQSDHLRSFKYLLVYYLFLQKIKQQKFCN